MLLFFSGADPTISERGGDPALEISVDVPCSDMVGVDGRLREIDDKEGWREVRFCTAADRVLDRSVTAGDSAASAFGVVVVVSRKVLGRPAEVQSGDLTVCAFGVLGKDSMVIGVATILCEMTWGFVVEVDTPSLGFCASAAEISSFRGGIAVGFCDEDCLSLFSIASCLGALPVFGPLLDVSSAPESWLTADLGLMLIVRAIVSRTASTFSSAEILSFSEFETATSLVSSAD